MRVLSLGLLITCCFSPAEVFAQLPVAPPTSPAAKAQPQATDLCPLTIYIHTPGHLYDSRFGGRYRVTEQTLRNDVGGGCKERGPTSSVRIQASPHTKYGRVKDVMDLVQSVRANVPVIIVTPQKQH